MMPFATPDVLAMKERNAEGKELSFSQQLQKKLMLRGACELRTDVCRTSGVARANNPSWIWG
jgi:hypothetical protein